MNPKGEFVASAKRAGWALAQRFGRVAPPGWRRKVGRWLRDAPVPPAEPEAPVAGAPSAQDYASRAEQETARFAEALNVHDLPPIFHYWANRHLVPRTRDLGFSNVEEFFASQLEIAARRATQETIRFLSVGSGNCDTEVSLAMELRRRGLDQFTIECLDLNPAMIDRGRALAATRGVERHIVPVVGDLNSWRPDGGYDGVLANQSLHHVVELESLLGAIRDALTDEGSFVVSDMIGRNGHQRWPEALAIVHEFWRELPQSYRYNLQLHRPEPEFQDWDCAVVGFEGVRAQDVLPLIIERFGFELFFAYGNVIDPFVDRSFGPHLDPAREWDRDFIDRVHARDEAELLAGTLKPTHMFAVMRRNRAVTPRVWRHLTPEFSVRVPR